MLTKVRTIGFGLAQTFIDRISNQLNRHMHIWSTSFQQSCQINGKKIISSIHGAPVIEQPDTNELKQCLLCYAGRDLK